MTLIIFLYSSNKSIFSDGSTSLSFTVMLVLVLARIKHKACQEMCVKKEAQKYDHCTVKLFPANIPN
jgi:hypothetical protein